MGYELYHHGVKGMKWGVRKSSTNGGAFTHIRDRRKQKRLDDEKRQIVGDAALVKAKAPKGTHMSVTGRYTQKRANYIYTVQHIVNDQGKVKLSYFRGTDGDRYIGAGKSYIDKHINLKDHFKNTKDIRIEYDVYD